MNVLSRFTKNFGLKSEVGDEKRRFVERMHDTVYRSIQGAEYPLEYESIFRSTCFVLGENADDRIRILNQRNYNRFQTVIPELRTLSQSDFTKTMLVICIVYDYLEGKSGGKSKQALIDAAITAALALCQTDIGIRWNAGMFYKSGATSLDEALINDPLEWLDSFPAEKTDYQKALEFYTKGELGPVITHCYNAIEGLARKVLKNERTLQGNIKELQTKFVWSEEMGKLISLFFGMTNELQRHASEERHKLKEREVEAFIYLTGTIARLILKSAKK